MPEHSANLLLKAAPNATLPSGHRRFRSTQGDVIACRDAPARAFAEGAG